MTIENNENLNFLGFNFIVIKFNDLCALMFAMISKHIKFEKNDGLFLRFVTLKVKRLLVKLMFTIYGCLLYTWKFSWYAYFVVKPMIRIFAFQISRITLG